MAHEAGNEMKIVFNELMSLRSFAGREQLGFTKVYEMDAPRDGECEAWCVSLVREDGKPEPILEFYALSSSGNMVQFVSSYYLETLMEHDWKCALALDGGVPYWTISASDLMDIVTDAKAYAMTI